MGTEEARSSGEERTPDGGGNLITWSTPVFRLGRFLCWMELLLLHRMRVEGRHNVPDGPVVLLSNHQSFLDIPLVANAMRPRHVSFVARETLARSRFLGWIMHHSGAVLIKRGGADRAALNEMVGHLHAGDCIAIFPEGTRSRDGSLGEFRGGALLAARRAGVPIVPTAIRGAIEALPRTAVLPRPRRIGIRFGKPLDPRDEGALERARCEIRSMIGDGGYASGVPSS